MYSTLRRFFGLKQKEVYESFEPALISEPIASVIDALQTRPETFAISDAICSSTPPPVIITDLKTGFEMHWRVNDTFLLGNNIIQLTYREELELHNATCGFMIKRVEETYIENKQHWIGKYKG